MKGRGGAELDPPEGPGASGELPEGPDEAGAGLPEGVGPPVFGAGAGPAEDDEATVIASFWPKEQWPLTPQM